MAMKGSFSILGVQKLVTKVGGSLYWRENGDTIRRYRRFFRFKTRKTLSPGVSQKMWGVIANWQRQGVEKYMALSPIDKDEVSLPVNKDKALSPVKTQEMQSSLLALGGEHLHVRWEQVLPRIQFHISFKSRVRSGVPSAYSNCERSGSTIR